MTTAPALMYMDELQYWYNGRTEVKLGDLLRCNRDGTQMWDGGHPVWRKTAPHFTWLKKLNILRSPNTGICDPFCFKWGYHIVNKFSDVEGDLYKVDWRSYKVCMRMVICVYPTHVYKGWGVRAERQRTFKMTRFVEELTDGTDRQLEDNYDERITFANVSGVYQAMHHLPNMVYEGVGFYRNVTWLN